MDLRVTLAVAAGSWRRSVVWKPSCCVKLVYWCLSSSVNRSYLKFTCSLHPNTTERSSKQKVSASGWVMVSVAGLTAIFHVDLGQPVPERLRSGFIGAKDDESGDDSRSYKTCKAPVKSSPTNKQTPNIFQAGCASCCPTNSVRALKGSDHHVRNTCRWWTPSCSQMIATCIPTLWSPQAGCHCRQLHALIDGVKQRCMSVVVILLITRPVHYCYGWIYVHCA